MSTDQLSQRRSPQSRGNAKLVSYDEYIDTQVESTRRLVKVVDLATSLVVLAAGVLAFLLAVAVVEHWLVTGGFPVAMRTALFALLAGGVGYFAYRRIWPLVIRTINPVYAAQTIEAAAATGPSLKNSLINLLLFRQRRGEISDAVYQTLEEQAAQRLSRVPVDAAVDRSLLIRFGYVLLAVVAVASLYKMFSPKDPLIAAQRVLMPWADIVPASRVSIRSVEPGAVTVSRGEFIDVSAEVRGIGEDDPVLLRFTTDDGQAVNKPIPMKLSKDGLRFEGRLPEGDGGSGNAGLAQNARYRIEAGDARTLDYAVTVVAAPSILVERVEYDYADYTGFVNRQVKGLGDIRAIEGTRVTIHARANGTIRQAHVDFDADGRRDLDMTATGAQGQASFILRLREDRATPEHASYVLRFTNGEGRTNRDPVKYSIHVEPDIGPEASILRPEEKELQVRLDEMVAIEVEARDPDFALAEVRLRGEVAGREVLNEPLFDGRQRRFTTRYQLTPSAHGLRAGDVVKYWVTADDNRTPQPNSAASERKLLRIVSPDPAQQPPPDRLAQRDQPPQAGGEQRPQNGQPQGGEQQDRQPGEEQQPGAAGGEGQRGEGEQPQNGQASEKGDHPFSRDAERSAGEEQAEGERGRGGEGEKNETGQSRDSDQQGGPQDRQARPGQRSSNDKQTGAGAAGGEPSGPQPAGTRQPDEPGAGSARPDGNRGEGPVEGQRQTGKGQRDPNAEQTPVSSEGDNDADAFERIRRHLERGGELPKEPSGTADEGADDVKRDAERSAEPGQGDKKTARQGEAEAGGEDAPARDESAHPGERAEERGGSGAETKSEELKPSQKKSGDQGEKKETPGGREDTSGGPPGAGEETQLQGAPDSEEGMKPGEKRQPSPSARERSDATEPPAGGRGKKESDSRGEQGGDRSGGGEEGGGQEAPREGTGSSGQDQAADEGAGESTEQGSGTDSPNAGNDATADDRTGKPGEGARGVGSEQREGEGQEPGGEAGERAAEPGQGDKETRGQGAGEAGGEDAPARAPRDSNDSANQQGAPTGSGGERGTAEGRPPKVDGTAPDGDEANLEYARKQTDLVLEKLAEQLNRKRVDDELLEGLGWSEAELRRFVERWQVRKAAAQRDDQSGKAAQRELDEALRSLGLRRGPLQQGPLKEDTLRDLREGYRGAVPLEYQERLRAYNEGVSRARRDGVE